MKSSSGKSLFLSSLGMVNALGKNKAEILSNLLSGNNQGLVSRSDYLPGNEVIVGEVNLDLPLIEKEYLEYNYRTNRLLLAAFEQIREEARRLIDIYGSDRIAVVLGTSTAGIAEGEAAYKGYLRMSEFPENYRLKQQELGSVAEFLAVFLGLTNMAITISTACSSSARAFVSARNFIEAGICDAAIVGGVDSLCKLTVNGFNSLELLSPAICNPFSKNRNGINIGEGATVFLMSRELSAIQLLGAGESSDAYHISAPHPEGKGAELAMIRALREAGLETQDIGYINLHGTATIQNDEVESRAISRMFENGVSCSSTKPMTGHTLGAAGAMEVGLCWLILSDLNSLNKLPPHLWDGEQDENLPQINLTNSASALSFDKRNLMSNSFAFGGSNASVIIGDAKTR